jgi:hypothetical protein
MAKRIVMNYKAFFIGLVLLAIVSCNDQEPESDFIFGNNIELNPGQTIWSNNNQISIKIVQINDSRCPLLYECIWQGEARVKFKLSYMGVTNFELSTFFNQTDTIQNLAFKLVEVKPYPISDETIELKDYTVTLEIKKLTD